MTLSLTPAAFKAFAFTRRGPALRAGLAAALLALPLSLTAPATATAGNVDFRVELRGPHGGVTIGNGRGWRHERHHRARRAVLHPTHVVRRLRRQGYHDLRGLTYVPHRAVYRTRAVTREGERVRLLVDARTGSLLTVRYLGRDRLERRGRGGRGYRAGVYR